MPIPLILFIVIPILELWVLIKVGSVIGATVTIGLVFVTAIAGAMLLRHQGLQTLARAQQRMRAGELPAEELVAGVFLAVGGALLLTPGFITDIVGFCCLIPGPRHILIGWGLRRFRPRSSAFSAQARTIEGEFHREEDK